MPCPLQYTGSSSYTDQQNSAKYNSSAALNKYGWYPQVSLLACCMPQPGCS
jgi:hypothetical protein